MIKVINIFRSNFNVLTQYKDIDKQLNEIMKQNETYFLSEYVSFCYLTTEILIIKTTTYSTLLYTLRF